MTDLRIAELGKFIKGGDYQVEKAVEISIGREEDGYTVWFQGWPVGKLDFIICDKIDVDDLLRRTRQAIEDCLANLPGGDLPTITSPGQSGAGQYQSKWLMSRSGAGGKLERTANPAGGVMKDLISPLSPARPLKDRTCPHRPRCPNALAVDRLAARAVACHPEQGWSLLCNGVVLFDDAGQLLPDGRAVAPAPAWAAAAA